MPEGKLSLLVVSFSKFSLHKRKVFARLYSACCARTFVCVYLLRLFCGLAVLWPTLRMRDVAAVAQRGERCN